MSASNTSNGRRRLESWKEIAAFFGRTRRTVNRWEKELSLPIHRLPGTKGRVYAYTEELSAWSAARKDTDASPWQDSTGQPGPGVLGLITAERQLSVDAGPLERISGEEERAASAGRYRSIIRLLVPTIIGGVVVLLLLYRGTSHSSKMAGHAASLPPQVSASGAMLVSTRSRDPEAEQLYLKGRYYWDKRTPADLDRALDYFTQAVVHDPYYSPAYSGLADCYNLLREYTLMPSSEAYPRALAAAKKAVELDDQSSEAHASLAFVSFFGMWDIATGEQEFRRAIDLNPNNATAHHWYANALLTLHRLPEALAEIDRAQTLDPASSAILADKGNILCAAGRLDEALSLLKQMERRDPSFRSPHRYLQVVYFRKQEYPNFLSELRKDALLVHDDSALAIANAAEKGYAAAGARGMLEAMLRIQKTLYAQHSIPPTAVAWTLALLGNRDEALRYLNAAYETRDDSLLFVAVNPEFDVLHEEPAYRDLIARLNLTAKTAR
jgi:tetratricopeptide (TPR) repeat protein